MWIIDYFHQFMTNFSKCWFFFFFFWKLISTGKCLRSCRFVLDRNVNIGNQSFSLRNLTSELEFSMGEMSPQLAWLSGKWWHRENWLCLHAVCVREGWGGDFVSVCGDVGGSPGGTDGNAEPGVHLRRVGHLWGPSATLPVIKAPKKSHQESPRQPNLSGSPVVLWSDLREAGREGGTLLALIWREILS